MKTNWKGWFAHAWPFEGAAKRVLGDYASIGAQHRHFLTDLALRGNVYDEKPDTTDPMEVGIWLGRRALALETIKLCNATPEQLFDFVPTKTRPS